MLKRILLVVCLACGIGLAASAQTAQVLPGCGQASPVLGPGQSLTLGPTGVLCADVVVQSAAAYRGGTIATAGVSQQLMAANPARRGYTVQNQSTGDLYIKVGAAATTNNLSLRIAPGQLYETPSHHTSTNVVNITGATAGAAYYATEF